MIQLVLILVSMLASQGAPDVVECRPDSPAVRRIRSVAEGIITADNNRDIAYVLDSYAADAILLPPNEREVRGRDAIRPRYEALFSGFNPQIEGHIDEACVAGSVAFVRGRNTGRLAGRGQQSSRVLNDSYLMLLRLQLNGSWQISHLMWHAAAPPQLGTADQRERP